MGQVAVLVSYIVHVEEPAARDAAMLELLLGVALACCNRGVPKVLGSLCLVDRLQSC